MPYPVAAQIELARDGASSGRAGRDDLPSAPALALRWRIVLAASDGLKNTEIAQRLAVTSRRRRVAQAVCV
jgi:DNA-binding NarL/FixJ family response regulator